MTPGVIGVNGNNVFYSGVLIGTFGGGTGLSPLTVTFNANATQEAVQKLMRKVAFRSSSATPTMDSRKFSVTLTLESLTSTPQVISMQIHYA